HHQRRDPAEPGPRRGDRCGPHRPGGPGRGLDRGPHREGAAPPRSLTVAAPPLVDPDPNPRSNTSMLKHRRTAKLIASLAALSLLAAACGDDDDDTAGEQPAAEDGGTDDGTGEGVAGTCETALDEDDSVESLAELDFSGLSVNVGSKDFVEQ